MTEEFVVLELGIDLGELEKVRGAQSSTASAPMSAREVLVSRPKNRSVSEIIKTHAVSDRRDAEEAARDPRNVVSRQMPISVIEPLEAKDFGSQAVKDDVDAAKAAGITWGVEKVLGPNPRDLKGDGVKVCVLDTGIDADHPAFAGVRDYVLNHRRNFVPGSESDHDVHGHGTHCAGTIFGGPVDGVHIGVAPRVSEALIGKVLDDQGRGQTKPLIDALNWAHSEGANIVSMSLGFDFPGMQKRLMAQGHPADLATSITLKVYRDSLRQFEILSALLSQQNEDSRGVVIIAASGNESRRHINKEHVIDATIPASASRDIISVGAVSLRQDGLFDIAPFSNINPVVCGPGVGVVSAKTDDRLEALNGTSMACPHVAGVAALWWQWIHSRTGGQMGAEDVRARLRATVNDSDFAASVTIADRGSGFVQAPQEVGTV